MGIFQLQKNNHGTQTPFYAEIQRSTIKTPSPPRSAVPLCSSSTASPSAAPATATCQSQNSASPSSASIAAFSLPLIPSTALLLHQRSHYSSLLRTESLTHSLDPIALPEVRISRLVTARVVRACQDRLRPVKAGLRLRVGFLIGGRLGRIEGLIRR